MANMELFIEVVNKLSEYGISMSGTMVCLYGEPKFNTEAFNFAYNIMRLGQLIDEVIYL